MTNLTVAEVAAELRCCEDTIRRRIKAGDLPAVFDGGRFLVSRESLDGYMRRRLVVQPAVVVRRRRRSP